MKSWPFSDPKHEIGIASPMILGEKSLAAPIPNWILMDLSPSKSIDVLGYSLVSWEIPEANGGLAQLARWENHRTIAGEMSIQLRLKTPDGIPTIHRHFSWSVFMLISHDCCYLPVLYHWIHHWLITIYHYIFTNRWIIYHGYIIINQCYIITSFIFYWLPSGELT